MVSNDSSSSTHDRVRTVGVEEELLLLAAANRAPRAVSSSSVGSSVSRRRGSAVPGSVSTGT
jgi:glutamate---cysteine ligase / carboxylate-amine ligase